MGSCPAIPLPGLRRLPIYYRRLRRAIDEGQGVISSQELGEAADVPAAQVRKDLSTSERWGAPASGTTSPSWPTTWSTFSAW